MNRSVSKAKGFTLIELIVVIVILGIMAAIAGPKFVDLQSDARASVMQGVEGSVRSASTLIFSKSLIAGIESDATGTVNAPAATAVVYGYPADTAITSLIDLTGASDVTVAGAVFTHSGRANCTVTYAEPTGVGLSPTITLDGSGC